MLEEFKSKSNVQLPTSEITITDIMKTGIMATMVVVVVGIGTVVVIMTGNPISRITCMVRLERSIQVMAIAICVVSMMLVGVDSKGVASELPAPPIDIIWLAVPKGKMNKILHCDALPEWGEGGGGGGGGGWNGAFLPAVSCMKDGILYAIIIMNPSLAKFVWSRRWLNYGTRSFWCALDHGQILCICTETCKTPTCAITNHLDLMLGQ